jgi:RimJ/RimL family protein N-acetyltransferase
MYRDSLTDGITLLPSGALTMLEDIRRMTEGKFMLMCVDSAVAEEQDIRLGAFSPHTKVSAPLPCMPTNYHALALYLRSLGANTWHEKISDGHMYFMVAVYDAEEKVIADGLQDLLPSLVSAHDGEAKRFTKLVQRQLLTVPDCLALLQRTNFDPLIIEEFYPVLETADWKLQSASKPLWQKALARSWSQYLPRPNDIPLHKKIVPLAMGVGHYGLVRECLQASLGYFGENVDELCQLADCALRTGDNSEAQSALRKALAIQRLHPAANAAMAEVDRRLENEKMHTWFQADLAKDEELRLEPLSSHHAEQYHNLYRDPQIGILTMLPSLNSLEQTKSWIASESAEAANRSCAVIHDSWGLIGFVSAQCNEDAAFFAFWIGTDHQGHGYGKKAGTILMSMLNKTGIRDVFSSSFSDNQRSHRALKAIGFKTLNFSANDPYESLAFFHMGDNENQENVQEKLVKLCAAFDIPYEFETASAEQA